MKKGKQLKAPGKGEYTYDYKNDVLLFKIKDRDYSRSLDFGNLIADIDTEGFITGLRIFDATKVFRLTKIALSNVKQFEFNTNVEDNIVKIQLRFMPVLRNKVLIKQGQDFEREALDANIPNSDVMCTVA